MKRTALILFVIIAASPAAARDERTDPGTPADRAIARDGLTAPAPLVPVCRAVRERVVDQRTGQIRTRIVEVCG